MAVRTKNSGRKTEDLEFTLMVSLSLFLSLQMVAYDLTLLMLPLIIVGVYVQRLLLYPWQRALYWVGIFALYLEFLGRGYEVSISQAGIATPLAFSMWVGMLFSILLMEKASSVARSSQKPL